MKRTASPARPPIPEPCRPPRDAGGESLSPGIARLLPTLLENAGKEGPFVFVSLSLGNVKQVSRMLDCKKDRFSLPADLHYFNCAYMSPLLQSVEEAGVAGVRRKRNPVEISPASFFAESDEVRRLFAQLVGVSDFQRIAIIPAVSYGMSIAARNTPIEPGQTILTAAEQFPSHVYPWRRLADEAGATLRRVAPPEGASRRGAAWNERLLAAIDERTALVALPHVHWADGTRFDLEVIGAKARAAGAALVVDGTQSVGALPLDVKRIQPDALICAGYKWLLGPYSIGVAYFGSRYDEGVPLEENWINRQGSEDFSGLSSYQEAYQPGAVRYDVGERSNPILLPMLAAALRQLLTWKVSAVQAYCRALIRPLVEEARALGYEVEEEAWRGGHLFGLRLPRGAGPDAVQSEMEKRKVVASTRGSALRLSPHLYNDEDDVEALLCALRAAAPKPAAR